MASAAEDRRSNVRVMFITGSYPPMKCGVGDYSAIVAGKIAESPGNTVAVLTSQQAREAVGKSAVEVIPVVYRWNIFSVGKVIRAVKKWQPDIVHIQYPTAGYDRVFMPNLLPLLLRLFKIPVVQTWHEPPIYSQLINAIPTDSLVVVEPRYPTGYSRLYRAVVQHKDCTFIPIGSNIPRVVPSPEVRSALRRSFLAERSRLIVYFGFALPFKGMELLFQAADPARDRLLLICDLDPNDAYHAAILAQAESPPWKGKCFVTGYLPAPEVAVRLALSDIALFPFTGGNTARNGSVLAARLQGTLVVTTHAERRGYEASEHTAYVAPGDVNAMREAIDASAGTRSAVFSTVASWEEIASRHCDLYEHILRSKGTTR